MEVVQLLKKNGQLLTSVLPAFYSFFFPNFVNIDGVVDDGDDDSDDADHLVDISFRHNSNKLSEGAAVELIHQTSLVMQLMVNVVVALLQLVLHQLVLLIRRSMNVDSLWIPILSSM
ncbi:unnamed protein product [Gongylonema pulchrum]|uniref:Transmembrane protein n=1 Tax=Gongylonema pulchrum TaxID=637853 RepID=A0A183EGV3_9BILA|nr:unnamed protein product [Gongylonema pulchrum]